MNFMNISIFRFRCSYGLLLSCAGFLWLSLCIFNESIGHADTPLMRTFGARLGFSAHIYNLAQDPDGVIWAAQDGGGVIAFDGKETKRYTTREGLPSNTVNNVMLDSRNRIWASVSQFSPVWMPYDSLKGWRRTSEASFTTSNHVIETKAREILVATDRGVFEFVDERWQQCEFMKEFPSDEIHLAFLMEDSRERLFGISKSGKVWRFRPGKPVMLWQASREMAKPMKLLEGKDGRIFITGYRKGLLELDDSDQVRSARPEHDLVGENRVVNAMITTSDGREVIGTWGDGILILENGGIVQSHNKTNGFPIAQVESIFEDREGNLLISGLGGGLVQLVDPRNSKFRNITTTDGLASEVVWDIQRDAENVFHVLSSGNYLTSFYPDGSIRTVELTSKGVGPSMWGLREGRNGLLWVFGVGGAYLLDADLRIMYSLTSKRSPAFKQVNNLYETADGRRLVLTTGNGLLIQYPDGSLETFGKEDWAAGALYEMALDDKGRFVFASDLGVAVFDPVEKKGRLIKKYETNRLNGLMGVARDRSGRIWFASGRGAICWHHDVFRLYTVADGLPNDNAYLVVADDEDGIWIGTSEGVARVSPEGKVRSYGYADGMLNAETNQNGGYLDTDGTVWFATPNGIAGIHPSKMPAKRKISLASIQQIEVNGQPLPELNRYIRSGDTFRITLPHDKNDATFMYRACHFTHPDGLTFQTRLFGADSTWSKETGIRQISYKKIPPGNYRFAVRACDPDHVCTNSYAATELTIVPPYWQRLWFRAFLIVAGLISVMGYTRFRLFALRKQRNELEKLVEARTQEIREMTLRDPLTNLRNRRYIHEFMSDRGMRPCFAAGDRRRKSGEVYGLMMMDIDHFKRVNDTYGHESGDCVLLQLGNLIEDCLRAGDVVCRWGGEEFLIVASGINDHAALKLAERLRKTVEKTKFRITNGRSISLTCSIGVASYPFSFGREEPLDWEQVRNLADLALYRAKETGRNQAMLLRIGKHWSQCENRERFLADLQWALDRGYVKLKHPKDP